MEDKERKAVVQTCQYFDISTRALGKRFFEQQGRQTYITPTSYLELVKAFKGLLSLKRAEIMKVSVHMCIFLYMHEFVCLFVCFMWLFWMCSCYGVFY